MTTLDPEDLIGREIGRYTLDRLIGHGGFAWVFAGRQTSDGRQVAVKILKPRYAHDPEFEKRFRNEAQLASEFQHPNVVHILEVGQADDFTYFSMELYADSLGAKLKRGETVPEENLLQIARDLASGLAYAHDKGIIHRDIKVDNVLLRDDGTAVIADFGIARAVSGYVSATGVNMTIGTPQYISPEQAQGRTLDGRSDLYALGVTLYKAATGDVPFRSSDWFELARMHVEEQPVAPTRRRPDLSARLERVILKCLAKHPDDRYPSAAALAEELQQLADQERRTESFGIAPMSSREMAAALAETGKRPKWLIPVLAVVVVIAVALAVVVLGG
ncbi:MAG: serine/threonine-protein kinase [Gemmatimonadales bacterium]